MPKSNSGVIGASAVETLPGGLRPASREETFPVALAAVVLSFVAFVVCYTRGYLLLYGDAVAHLALRGTLRQAYQRAGLGQDYDPTNVQMLAHQDPMAYASGVTTLYGRQKLEASQMIGSFGQEFLLAGEDGQQREVPQFGGATTTTALPLVYLTTQATLIGEEIYAAEAYLARSPAPLARLLTQDALRTAVIIAIIILMILAAAGLQISL